MRSPERRADLARRDSARGAYTEYNTVYRNIAEDKIYREDPTKMFANVQ